MSLDTEEIIKENTDDYELPSDLKHEFKTQYRLIRRKLSAFIRYHLKKTFIDILYITVDDIPEEYILSLQKQYPDKIIKVLTLHTPEFENKANLIDKFTYCINNNSFYGEIYEYPITDNNIQIYGISSDGFVNLKHKDEVYNFKYLPHFAICSRFAAKKLKADIIHSENIPFLLGMEFNKKNNSYKLFQTFHHYPIFQEIEPFWAAINMLDKKGIKRILKDKTIKKNLTALFGIKTPKGSTQIKNCLEYFFKNYEEFRNNIAQEELVNENILIKRLNDRIIKLFPQAFAKNTDNFNPAYYTIKHSAFYGFNSMPAIIPEWIKQINMLERKNINSYKNKVVYTVDKNNSRETKDKNKKYLIKEFASERIQTKFTDLTLFNEDAVKISGNLDIFYRGALLLAFFGRESTENEIKTTSLAILKCFEQRKNIQIIFNIPKDFNNNYFKSLIEFIETQKAMTGKWLVIEGKINLEQFTSSADMVLMPYCNIIGIENILYTSLKNGCIPVMLSDGICADAISDIYDDLNIGCGFKVNHTESNDSEKDDEPISDIDLYTNTVFKALTFYKLNSSGWNRLVKNAMNCDTSWNFELIEKYNNIYDDII